MAEEIQSEQKVMCLEKKDEKRLEQVLENQDCMCLCSDRFQTPCAKVAWAEFGSQKVVVALERPSSDPLLRAQQRARYLYLLAS